MNIEEIKKNAPDGVNHIDKSGDYWNIVSDDESYFYDTLSSEWIRYAFNHNEHIELGFIKPL